MSTVSACQRNDHHMSSFVFACFHNQHFCFKALYEHVVRFKVPTDAKAVIGDDDVQLECLAYVVQHNNYELLRYLITEVNLSKSVLQRQIASEGKTITHIAAELGHDLMLYFFGEMGLDIDAVDAKGNSPLHVAVENKRASSLKFLLSMNAELNVKNNQGRTPLHAAVLT